MAVFMENICKFNGCGLTFETLPDLIWHIEEIHIDYDPVVREQKEKQKPQCMPLSYILPFFTDAARKDHKDTKEKLMKAELAKTAPHPVSPSGPPAPSSVQSVTPNGSELDDDDDDVTSELDDSNDSWATPEEYKAEYILRYGSRMVTPSSPGPNGINLEKPFACPVPGCKKRYKNVNGIKYHSKNGHKHDGRVRKCFKCHCGKSYRTGSGLKYHTSVSHTGANMTTLTTQTGEVLQVPTSHVTTLQPIRALTLKHIASLGLPVKTLVVASKPARPPSPAPSLGVLTPATSPHPTVPSSPSAPTQPLDSPIP